MGYLADSGLDMNPLITDLYQLTMSNVDHGLTGLKEEGAFYLHWRTPPYGGGYTVAAGLEGAIDFIKHFKISDDDIDYLRSIKKSGKRLFDEEFLNHIQHAPLDVDVDAVAEGEVVTTSGPVLRLKGPKWQCLLLESPLLNIINSNSMIATRAARIDEAIDGRGVFADFGLRRGATLDPSPARASFIGGAIGVANVDAARKLGVTPIGTMSHAFVQGFRKEGVATKITELEAFEAYLKGMPTNSTLLVDTYDIGQGVDNAIKAALRTGVPLASVRLDSGDPFAESWKAKEKLEQAAKQNPELFAKTSIALTNDLDETIIATLMQRSFEEKGEPFPATVFGVGTALNNPGPLGGVYKLSAYGKDLHHGSSLEATRSMKVAGKNPDDPTLPGSKSSMPGIDLDTLRLFGAQGEILADVIIDTALAGGTQPEFLQSGQAISLSDSDKRRMKPLPAAAHTETLLKPVFRRRDNGLPSEYVYAEPAKKAAWVDEENGKQGPEVTDLGIIQAFHKSRRSQLPEAVRSVLNPQRLPVFLDPRINETQREILAALSVSEPEPKTRDIDIFIDVQNGFASPDISVADGGSLYVPGGEDAGRVMGKMISQTRDGIFVISQDFHPENHFSFVANHPGIVAYREANNVAALSELVLDFDDNIIGLKEGDRIRKVELSVDIPSAENRGRVTRVLDSYLDRSFSDMSNEVYTQMLWPHHCVQGTLSAAIDDKAGLPQALKEKMEQDLTSPNIFHRDEATGNLFVIVRKGMNSEVDSYGMLVENNKKDYTEARAAFIEIANELKRDGVKKARFNIGGLASNFCVEFSHNNLQDEIIGIFKVRGMEAEVNLVQDLSHGIPIPGGKDDPFSLEGAPLRMQSYSPRSTTLTYSDAVLNRRIPQPELSGALQAHSAELQRQMGA